VKCTALLSAKGIHPATLIFLCLALISSVSCGGGRGTVMAAVTGQNNITQATTSVSVKLATPTMPSQGQAGVNLIYVTGSGFPAGPIPAGNVTVKLMPASAGPPSATTVATQMQNITGSTWRAQFAIPSSLTPASATNYNVTLSGTSSGGTGFTSGNSAALTIIPPATASLSPDKGDTGTTLTVTISGTNGGFVQGSTEANFGPGTSVGGGPVGGLGPVKVTGPNSATATVTISSSAPTGTVQVLIETGSEEILTPFTIESVIVLQSCVPTSSLSALTQGKNVSSYVPNGNWGSSSLNVQLVPVEGSGSRATITTPNSVNSCASNSVTGQTVCTANNTDVYLISGSTLSKTLSSSSDGTADFSGGSCQNCGVAINAVTNQAIVAMGLSGSPSRSGIQFLDLNTNTFATPINSQSGVSEDISIDPNLKLILSPNESNNYELIKFGSSTGVFENPVSSPGGRFDSAAEDCTTGIALSAIEFSGNLFIADLTQATFTAGSPAGTWSAPSQVQSFPEFINFEAGTDGIAVAPGTHLGFVTGEFGGNSFGAIQLPSTSGSGTPAVSDWVAATMPNTPDGNPFSFGFDPHTVTAYKSPNSAKALALVAGWGSQPGGNTGPIFLGVIDLQALLAAKRSGGHTVDPSVDLLATGIVKYISVF